jgi:hypothetical protein
VISLESRKTKRTRHFVFAYIRPVKGKGEEQRNERRSMFEALQEATKSLREDPQANFFLFGDFNDTYDDSTDLDHPVAIDNATKSHGELARLVDSYGLTSVLHSKNPKEKLFSRESKRHVKRLIDHVLVGSNTDVSQLECHVGHDVHWAFADHAPLFLEENMKSESVVANQPLYIDKLHERDVIDTSDPEKLQQCAEMLSDRILQLDPTGISSAHDPMAAASAAEDYINNLYGLMDESIRDPTGYRTVRSQLDSRPTTIDPRLTALNALMEDLKGPLYHSTPDLHEFTDRLLACIPEVRAHLNELPVIKPEVLRRNKQACKKLLSKLAKKIRTFRNQVRKELLEANLIELRRSLWGLNSKKVFSSFRNFGRAPTGDPAIIRSTEDPALFYTKPKEVKEHILDYFRKLQGSARKLTQEDLEVLVSDLPEISDPEQLRELEADFSMDELTSAIAEVKTEAATGPQPQVANALLKRLDPKAWEKILAFFNAVFKHGVTPPQWRVGEIKLLYKGAGHRADMEAYRPITLLDCLGKLYERLLNGRLTSICEKLNLFSHSQWGGRAGRSADMPVALLARAIQVARGEGGEDISIAFLDLSKPTTTCNGTTWRQPCPSADSPRFFETP